jgi:hypothetical protein
MVYRISVAEPCGKGQCSLDIVPIDCQVANVGSKVQHLADNAAEYQRDRRLDRFAAAGFRLWRMVWRPMQRHWRHVATATVKPAQNGVGRTSVGQGARVHGRASEATISLGNSSVGSFWRTQRNLNLSVPQTHITGGSPIADTPQSAQRAIRLPSLSVQVSTRPRQRRQT